MQQIRIYDDEYDSSSDEGDEYLPERTCEGIAEDSLFLIVRDSKFGRTIELNNR